MNSTRTYEDLFSPIQISNVEIKNRIALAPMSLESIIPFESSYVDNRCKEYLIRRAKGGVGLIIFSCWRVENEIEPMYHFQGNCLTKSCLYSFVELLEILHSFDTKVFFQLTAGYGRVGNPHPPGGGRPVSCSAIPAFWDSSITCRIRPVMINLPLVWSAAGTTVASTDRRSPPTAVTARPLVMPTESPSSEIP